MEGEAFSRIHPSICLFCKYLLTGEAELSMTSKVLPYGADVPPGRGMNIVSFTALRFGNLDIFSVWTIEEILSG